MLDITRVQVLSFDLDDTLWDNPPVIRRACVRLYRSINNDFPALQQQLGWAQFMRLAQDLADQGDYRWDLSALRREHIQRVLARIGVAATPEQIEHYLECFLIWRSDVELWPGVPALLHRLRSKFRLIAITNGNIRLQQTPIGDHFSACYAAEKAGAAKPSVQIYNYALAQEGISARALLHVGNSWVNDIEPVLSLGGQAIWFQRNKPEPDGRTAVGLERVGELAAITQLLGVGTSAAGG